MKEQATIDRICKGLRILERYCSNALVIGKNAATSTIELQELEFKDIREEDREALFSLNWKTNGHYLWYI